MSSAISSAAAARLSKVLPSLDSISASQLTRNPKPSSYHIPRSSKGNLPVYKTYRSQAVYTDINRVYGNIVQLRNDLQKLLPDIKKDKFVCRVASGSLRIKGDHSVIIKEILSQKF